MHGRDSHCSLGAGGIALQYMKHIQTVAPHANQFFIHLFLTPHGRVFSFYRSCLYIKFLAYRKSEQVVRFYGM